MDTKAEEFIALVNSDAEYDEIIAFLESIPIKVVEELQDNLDFYRNIFEEFVKRGMKLSIKNFEKSLWFPRIFFIYITIDELKFYLKDISSISLIRRAKELSLYFLQTIDDPYFHMFWYNLLVPHVKIIENIHEYANQKYILFALLIEILFFEEFAINEFEFWRYNEIYDTCIDILQNMLRFFLENNKDQYLEENFFELFNRIIENNNHSKIIKQKLAERGWNY